MEKRKDSIPARFFKFIISVVILSAFIIGIALTIKGVKSMSTNKVARSVSTVLSKLHINVEEEQLGDVAGKFVERVSNTNISSTTTVRDDSSTEPTNTGIISEVAIISDVQDDLASLKRSLDLIKERNITKVIVIGDLTNYGEVSNLLEVKRVLDESGLKYYTLPGDHDLAQSMGSDNFIHVFGRDNYVVDMDGYKFIFLDNSANYTTVPSATLTWFNEEVKNADFVVLSQPLYTDGLNLPFSKLYMGSTMEDPTQDLTENQQRVRAQRDILLSDIQNSSAQSVLAGDHHKSNTLTDTVRNTLTHNTLGAIANDLNGLPQRLLQSPRFSILNIYEDKSFKLEEVLID